MNRLVVIFLSSLILVNQAIAGSGTITVLDSTGATKTYDVITDGSGNFVSKMGICDQSAAANCAGVDAGKSLQVAGEGVAGTPAGGIVSIQGVSGGTNLPVSQATAASLNATVVGTGTFATQAAQSGTWNITNITGTVSLPTGAATSALQTTGNTALSTINTTLGSPFQAGGSIGNTSFIATQSTGSNLHIVCDSGCSGGGGGGGTSAVDEATFTQGTTTYTPVGGIYTTSVTNLTTGQAGVARLTNDRQLMVSDSALLSAANAPLPSMPVNKTPTACGGTVGTGGTAVTAITAQTTLQGFVLMNISADPMWISFTGTAAIGGANDSFLLPAGSSTVAGGSFAAPGGFGTNHLVSVNAATNGDAFSCVWW